MAIVGNWQPMFSQRISDVFTLKTSIQMLSQQLSNYFFFSFLLHQIHHNNRLKWLITANVIVTFPLAKTEHSHLNNLIILFSYRECMPLVEKTHHVVKTKIFLQKHQSELRLPWGTTRSSKPVIILRNHSKGPKLSVYNSQP